MTKQISISDSGKIEEKIKITRYEGYGNIRKMVNEGKLIEAYVHAQHSIERILWDKAKGLFEGERGMIMTRTIDESEETVSTNELLRWCHYLGVIDQAEYSALKNFNSERNKLIHEHGRWFYLSQLKDALNKGISFIEKYEK